MVMYVLVVGSPRTQSVVSSNPTQGFFFFEKRESCPVCTCISSPLLACHVHVHVIVVSWLDRLTAGLASVLECLYYDIVRTAH